MPPDFGVVVVVEGLGVAAADLAFLADLPTVGAEVASCCGVDGFWAGVFGLGVLGLGVLGLGVFGFAPGVAGLLG